MTVAVLVRMIDPLAVFSLQNLFIQDPFKADQCAVYRLYRDEIADLKRGVKCDKDFIDSTLEMHCALRSSAYLL